MSGLSFARVLAEHRLVVEIQNPSACTCDWEDGYARNVQEAHRAHLDAVLREWVAEWLDGEQVCTCPYTDPSTWLSAASCGYGSGYEPGSMQEYNPDCLTHGPAHAALSALAASVRGEA